jgi:hypothetical protein
MSLAAIQQLVDDKLRSASLGSVLADVAARDRAIAQAVLVYSADAPQRLNDLVAGISGSSFDPPPGWVAGRSQLDQVEYPLGQVPRAVLAAAVVLDDASELQIVLADQALSNATVRVYFTAPHTLTADASTVPAEHENALACWVAAELCLQLATQKGHERDATISAAAVNGQSQSGDLARRARDWLRTYRSTLGLPDPDDKPGVAAASSVVSWGRSRPRGRFSSLGY